MKSFVLNVTLLWILRGSKCGLVLQSSCTDATLKWNNRNVAQQMQKWFRSLKVVEGEAGTHLMLYNSSSGEQIDIASYRARELDKGRDKEERKEKEEEGIDVDGMIYDPELSVSVTASDGGLSWRRIGEDHEGYLYGQSDQYGSFSGESILFLYPDFQTGIFGRFAAGVLVEGREVQVTAERCNQGFKELQFEIVESRDHIWRPDVSDGKRIGSFPTTMDPFERKSVYVSESRLPDSDEGLFAKRDFLKGDLVSYYNGLRRVEDDFLFPNLTKSQFWIEQAYFVNLGEFCPSSWNMDPFGGIDIPTQYRDLKDYRATLAHKANHQFRGANVDFEAVDHPVFGKIACFVATKNISRGSEVFTNYQYDLEFAPPWYVQLYNQEKVRRQNKQRETKEMRYTSEL